MKKLPFPARSNTRNKFLKLLTIMKLSLMFILLAVTQTHAGVFAQGSITLSMRQVEIEKVLNKIEKEGEFRFLYNYDLNSLKKKVDVDFEESSISEVLNKIFANTDLTYKMLGNNLIVVLSSTQKMADIRITGKVTGANGEPLAGVSVTVKGGTAGTNTDNNGVYTLTV
ncbi:MAG TPA: secretin and TonB N-terminal domain-containing protein, partial [Puia sp.]|nr:secretin and TonB N-terminal domain-containing protein [Puia sp.]